ncbi:MAG TPA: GMC family oxidoreductase, partial [Devosia sp.]|nr:GMC family oxidoreductase [Devosia sp.]
MTANTIPAELLRAVVDRLIPADADPGALDLGTQDYVMRQLDGEARGHAQSIAAGLADLDTAVRARHGTGFAALPDAHKDSALATVQSEPWFAALAELCAEGFYADPGNGGNSGARSWAMIGYEHRLPEGPDGPPPAPEAVPPRRTGRPQPDYDCIVVGAGAAGGIIANVLAQAGKRVLVLERGPHMTYRSHGRRDHLRNQRLSRYGHNAGPPIEGNPRVLVGPDGVARTLRPHEGGYHNNAAAVGSGTVVYGMQAWRFLPDDFRMASRYGVPAGSSLTDWPIGYDDLAPYYEQAEWEIGVSGEGGANIGQGARRRGYPMPAMPQHRTGALLRQGAERLGIRTFTPPLLINSVPREERGACIECGSCVGFPCPSNAKNGTWNTVLPRALATGNCELVAGATVERIDTDAHGKVTGVSYVEEDDGAPVRRSARARAVVLCAGAIESARLLLLSASRHHPNGLGNARDQVGRNLQGHYYAGAWGQFEDEVYDPRGPGVTIATCDFNHGNDGIIGGGMLADDFIMLPVIFWKTARPEDAAQWGLAAKAFMRDN